MRFVAGDGPISRLNGLLAVTGGGTLRRPIPVAGHSQEPLSSAIEAISAGYYACRRGKKWSRCCFVKEEAKTGAAADPCVFATTHWSLILSAANLNHGEQKARAALQELCQSYWRPIFSFLCRRGYATQEAQDLTQDFFVMILESDWLQQADEHRGRFRSFLLKSLQNFLSHAHEKSGAVKRGGRVEFISWDDWMAEATS